MTPGRPNRLRRKRKAPREPRLTRESSYSAAAALRGIGFPVRAEYAPWLASCGSCWPPKGIAPGVTATIGAPVTIFGPRRIASGNQSEGTARDERNRRPSNYESKGQTERRLPVRPRPKV